jgi:hypothetical protein
MADITMCEGINCEQRETCYRYIAKESPYRQAYFEKTPVLKDGECEMFWDVREIKSR